MSSIEKRANLTRRSVPIDESAALDVGGASPILRSGHLLPAFQAVHASYRDFLLVFVASVLLFLLIGFEPWLEVLAPLRLVVGFFFVLFIPGYCLTATLFPQSGDLDGVERVGLSLGLSIGWVPLLALILNYLPWGLGLWPIAIAEVLSIAGFTALAVWRRARLPAGQIYVSELALEPRSWWRSLPTVDKSIQIVIAGALLIAGLSVTWVLLTPSSSEVTTEFYMLGSAGLAEDFPREAEVGEDLTITLGITNRELALRSYRVEVWVEDPLTFGRRERVAQAGPLTLDTEENQEWPVTWAVPWTGQDQKVEFLLFAGDDPQPYRRLYFFLNVEERAASLTDQLIAALSHRFTITSFDGAVVDTAPAGPAVKDA